MVDTLDFAGLAGIEHGGATLIHQCDARHIISIQLKIPNSQVFLHPLRMHGLRNDDDPLLNIPSAG